MLSLRKVKTTSLITLQLLHMELDMFIASLCVGLVAGIVVSNFESLKHWGDLIVGIAALCAKEVIDWLAKKMTNPLGFFQELRSQKPTDADKNPDNS